MIGILISQYWNKTLKQKQLNNNEVEQDLKHNFLNYFEIRFLFNNSEEILQAIVKLYNISVYGFIALTFLVLVLNTANRVLSLAHDICLIREII